MTDPIHISMDSETWGKRAGFDARSIGACVFDPVTGKVGGLDQIFEAGSTGSHEFYIACDNDLMGSYSSDHYTQRDLDKIGGPNRRFNLLRDPGTVDWWYDQEPAAQAAFNNPVQLNKALIRFSEWLTSVGVNPKDENSCRIWSHGAAFDPPIIEALYHAVGLPVPWHYRAPRDTRTVFDDAEVGNHSQWMKKHQQGVMHHALDDAISQARAIVGAKRRIRVVE